LRDGPTAAPEGTGGSGQSKWPGPFARSVLALIPCFLSVAIGIRFLDWMGASGGAIHPFSDAVTYLAAGERLAAGHPLYQLAPGDRPVLRVVGTSDAPLLSPPAIAVVWRGIVALPFGFELWVIACWACLLGTTFVLARSAGLPGTILATALSPAIAEQLAACNMAAFFPALLTLAWTSRSDRAAGAIVGAVAALKLAPASMAGWIVGGRRGALRAVVGTVAMIAVACVVGASPASLPEYIGVIRQGIGASWLSLSALTGIPWMSMAVLVVGTAVAVVLGRWPGASFTAAVLAAVLGTPALYLSGFVTLLAVLAPVAWPVSAEPVLVVPARVRSTVVVGRYAFARVPRFRRP